MGDLFFDLANFAINHELDDDGRAALLDAYFGDVPARRDCAALDLMRFMSDFREAMWGVVQSAVSELDVDFDAYAAEHFERMERTAAEPAFRAALAGHDEGRPQAPLVTSATRGGYAPDSVGSSNRARCSSSSRSSSSSVPMRTGP